MFHFIFITFKKCVYVRVILDSYHETTTDKWLLYIYTVLELLSCRYFGPALSLVLFLSKNKLNEINKHKN